MGKSPGVLENQNVYLMISNTGSSKPVQWLTDPYSNSYGTPANKNHPLSFFEGSCSRKEAMLKEMFEITQVRNKLLQIHSKNVN